MARHNAARTPLDAPTPDAIRVLRDRLVREQAAPKRRTPARLRLGWALATASVAGAATILATLTLPGAPAEAATPTPLSFDAPLSIDLVVQKAVGQLAEDDGVDDPVREVRSVSWGIVIEDGEIVGPVVPQISTLEWDSDLSGRSLIVQGSTAQPTDGDVGRVTPTDELVSDMSFEVGQFSVPMADLPAETDEGVRAMLMLFGMPEQPSPGQFVQSMVSALGLWTLSDDQHALLLDRLAETGAVESLGESVDRLGRSVQGLRVESVVAGTKDVVLVSSTTGRIVGVESQRVEADETVPTGTIVSYQLWDAEGEIEE